MTTTTLRLHYRGASHKVKNKVSSLAVVRIPWKLIYSLAITASLMMLFYYIMMVNQLTSGAYTIKNYNKQIASLMTENKALEAGFAESGFLQDVRTKAQSLSFEKTTNVKYVQIMKSSLADAR